MSRAYAVVAALVTWIAPGARAQEPVEVPIQETQVQSLDDLLKFVRERERAVESVDMEIESTGSFPDGSEFTTSGTLRVLGTTHFMARMKATFGEGMETETETVRTPEGMQMRERDPVQGEVFLKMDRQTLERIDSATRALGGDAEVSGFGTREAKSPLGSAILEDLARQFDLEIRDPQMVDGRRCWVVGGPLKTGVSEDEEPFGLGADQVDLLVRVGDGAVVRMTQLRQGKPLLDMRIVRLELDRPFDAASFVLEVPAKAAVIDVMDHPPASAQIERLFEEARAKGWTDPAGGEPAPVDPAVDPSVDPAVDPDRGR